MTAKNNWHTDWVDYPTGGYTTFSAASMNPVLQNLDDAITYFRNLIIYGGGNVTIEKGASSVTVTWSDTIRIKYLNTNGTVSINAISAGSITLGDGEAAYVTLPDADTTITISNDIPDATFFKEKKIVPLFFADSYFDIHPIAWKFPYGSNPYKTVTTVQTTDTTVTTVSSKTLSASTAYLVEAKVIGKNGNTDRVTYIRRALVYRAASTAVLEGSVQDALTVESSGASAWDCTIDVNSNDVRVRVTGANSTTIDWKCELQVTEV